MDLLKAVVFSIGIATTLILISSEISNVAVYGWFVPKEKLDPFMEKYITEYVENGVSEGRNIFYGSGSMPYIATARLGSPFFKYYISDIGTIPRWSKWTERLNEEMEKQPKRLTGIDKYLQ